MNAPLVTDAELSAAIARTARPATMVKLECGDFRILHGEYVVGDVVDCLEGECGNAVAQIVEAVPTSIV